MRLTGRSFYDWLVEEGLRPHNPARQTRRAKRRKPESTGSRLRSPWRSSKRRGAHRERRVAFVGVLAGTRRQELLDLKGHNFARNGWIRIVGKGAKERWVPVLSELAPVVAEIRSDVAHDEYVLPLSAPVTLASTANDGTIATGAHRNRRFGEWSAGSERAPRSRGV
jgi:site-specific recombinase XerC